MSILKFLTKVSSRRYLILSILNLIAVIFSIMSRSLLLFTWTFILLIISAIGYVVLKKGGL